MKFNLHLQLFQRQKFPKGSRSRRLGYFLLLEVLIAFALVVLAVLPLVYPHFYIYQQQRTFIDKIDLDLAVNLIYVKLLEKLHNNQISWMDIQNDRILPMDTSFIEQAGYDKYFPYEATYQFHLDKTKKNPQYALNLVDLTLNFTPKNANKAASDKSPQKETLTYTYELFIAQSTSAPDTVVPQAVTP